MIILKSTHKRIVAEFAESLARQAERIASLKRVNAAPVQLRVDKSKRGIWRWRAYEGDDCVAMQAIHVKYDSATAAADAARKVLNVAGYIDPEAKQ